MSADTAPGLAVVKAVEARLYAYGRFLEEQPAARISRAFEMMQGSGGEPSSEEERWVETHQDTIRDAVVLDKFLRKIASHERELIRLRYCREMPWRQVAKQLHMSRAAAFAIKGRLLAMLAYEFGLM